MVVFAGVEARVASSRHGGCGAALCQMRAGIAFHPHPFGSEVSIVSQEDAAVYLGQFDWETMEFLPGGQVSLTSAPTSPQTAPLPVRLPCLHATRAQRAGRTRSQGGGQRRVRAWGTRGARTTQVCLRPPAAAPPPAVLRCTPSRATTTAARCSATWRASRSWTRAACCSPATAPSPSSRLPAWAVTRACTSWRCRERGLAGRRCHSLRVCQALAVVLWCGDGF